jgi:hypothetical protein
LSGGRVLTFVEVILSKSVVVKLSDIFDVVHDYIIVVFCLSTKYSFIIPQALCISALNKTSPSIKTVHYGIIILTKDGIIKGELIPNGKSELPRYLHLLASPAMVLALGIKQLIGRSIAEMVTGEIYNNLYVIRKYKRENPGIELRHLHFVKVRREHKVLNSLDCCLEMQLVHAFIIS